MNCVRGQRAHEADDDADDDDDDEDDDDDNNNNDDDDVLTVNFGSRGVDISLWCFRNNPHFNLSSQ